MRPWPALESLIPHRAPMLLVEQIVEARDDGLVCLGRIPADGPLAAGQGVASAFLGLELAAQTAAVFEALRRGEGGGGDVGEPRMGYLASIRKASFQVPGLPAGRQLRATIRTAGSAPPLAMYSAEVTLEDDGSELLTATLSTYLVAPAPG